MKKKIKGFMRKRIKRVNRALLHFFEQEAASGVILLGCGILAMVLANSVFAEPYQKLLHVELGFGTAPFILSMSLLHWINDGLMAVFFFVIGMEIKREVLFGELKSLSATVLPVVAAVGGMLVPAGLYILVNWSEPTRGGWGVPMATDIAFALGLLSFAGGGAPRSIAIFLTVLAIVDDLGAILVIALFYTSELSWLSLGFGAVFLAMAALLNRWQKQSIGAYLICGLFAWYAFLQAGIHPTIAGVALGLLIPARGSASMLHTLETALAPCSAYVIMPLFALANAGVPIDAGAFADVFTPVGIGILLGLCVGKPLGIFASVYLLIKLKWAGLPAKSGLRHFGGAGILGGIGFTMSLFIASLAFSDPQILMTAKLSILCASLLAGLMGTVVFKIIACSHKRKTISE